MKINSLGLQPNKATFSYSLCLKSPTQCLNLQQIITNLFWRL